MTKTLKSLLSLVILFFAQTSIVDAQDVKNPFIGKWDAVVLGLPQGDIGGLLKIDLKKENLSGSFTDKVMKKELIFTSMGLKDSVLTAVFSYQGMAVTMTLKKKDQDNLEGLVLDSYNIKAVKIKE